MNILQRHSVSPHPAFGVDLGTARSGIAIATRGADAAVESVPMRKNPLGFRLPSLVVTRAVNGRVQTFAGDEACERLHDPHARTFSSAKSNLGLAVPFLHGLTTGFAKPTAVLLRILEILFRRARQHTGVDPQGSPLSIAVPASLPASARLEILSVAAKIGVKTSPEFMVEEPIAVLLDALYGPAPMPMPAKNPFTACVYDIGAGTCDVALFSVGRETAGNPAIRTLAIGDYDMLGGDNFDLAIAQRLLLPACLSEATPSPLTEILFIRKNMLAARRIKERLCDAVTEHLTRAGKSAANTPPLEYPELEVTARTFEVSTADVVIPAQTVRVTTRQMIEALRPFLSMDPEEVEIVEGRWIGSLLGPLHFTLGKAGRVVSDLDILILSGAACRAPFVPYLLSVDCASKGLDPDRIVHTDLDQAVQRGAAIHAWRLAATGQPPVTPILGADIGLRVYGGRYERLIAAGTILPCAEQRLENMFSVPEQNLDKVVVEVYAARRSGAKPSTLMRQAIELPPNTPAGEPVSVSIAVDQGKVITLNAALARHPNRSLRMVGEEIWLTGRGRPETAALKESRDKVRRAVEKTGMPALRDLMDWAAAEYRRRTSDSLNTAYEIVIGALDVHPETAKAWNLLGLVCEAQNRRLFAEQYFRQAVKHEPRCAAYRANLGWILLEMNRGQEAQTMLAAAYALDFAEPYIAELYARAIDADGEYETAKQVRLDTIRENTPASSRLSGARASWLARLYEGVGDVEHAEIMRRLEAKSDDAASDVGHVDAGADREALLAGAESPSRETAV